MKKVVIIGGGIAGLSAGIFAQKNGFESIILEKHNTLGGECTGWDRQGYHIDGCIHWLVGTKEGTPIRRLWETVGALDGIEIYHPESFLAFEHEGITVHFYRDLERLKSSWMEISPEDKDTIEEFCKDIKKLQSFEFPIGKPVDMMNILEKFKYIASMKDVGPIMQKYGKISSQEYAKTFKHPALREALAKDQKAYTSEKTRIGQEVVGAMETRFPYMKGKLKILDVASPQTYERYCNAYRGAFMGFWPTIRGKMMAHTGRIKGLNNIFLSGQWLQPPGGLPVAVVTGKDTIMRLCKKERKKFISH